MKEYNILKNGQGMCCHLIVEIQVDLLSHYSNALCIGVRPYIVPSFFWSPIKQVLKFFENSQINCLFISRKSCSLILPSTTQIGPHCFRVSWTIIIVMKIYISRALKFFKIF